jgi:hypothetical protein
MVAVVSLPNEPNGPLQGHHLCVVLMDDMLMRPAINTVDFLVRLCLNEPKRDLLFCSSVYAHVCPRLCPSMCVCLRVTAR